MFRSLQPDHKLLFAVEEPRVKLHMASLKGTFPPHSHDYMELVVVLGGATTHQCMLGRRPLRAGDVVAQRPGSWHAYEHCRRFHYIICGIGVDILNRELAWTINEPAIGNLLWNGPLSPRNHGIIIFHLDPRSMRRVCRLAKRLQRLTRKRAFYRRGEILGVLLLFLDELAYQYTPRPRLEEAGEAHPIAAKAIRLLESNLGHPWTRQELGAQVHMDPGHLGRVVKRATGLAPLHYLSRRRAERAASLLVGTTRRIGDIGLEIGWPEPFHFAHRFKTHFGVSAKEYRRRFQVRRQAPGKSAAAPPHDRSG